MLEVHAYSLLTNHFHLLVRSPQGKLSLAMLRIQNSYVLWFNRRYGRDGPLFQGRFFSKRILSDLHWRTVLRYVDQNAVEAGLTHEARDYPYCSLWHYLRPSGPSWLSRGEVEGFVCRQLGLRQFSPGDYDRAFGRKMDTWENEFVTRRMKTGDYHSDPLDDLVSSAPSEVRTWMKRQASLADGSKPGLPLVSPQTVAILTKRGTDREPGWTVNMNGREWPGWITLHAGLLRLVCGLGLEEIAMRLSCAVSTAGGRSKAHLHLLKANENYARIAGQVLSDALKLDWSPTKK
jgi:hypothetical protein